MHGARLMFDVHNDGLPGHIALWMPYFRVLDPLRYRNFMRELATQVATRNEGSQHDAAEGQMGRE